MNTFLAMGKQKLLVTHYVLKARDKGSPKKLGIKFFEKFWHKNWLLVYALKNTYVEFITITSLTSQDSHT